MRMWAVRIALVVAALTGVLAVVFVPERVDSTIEWGERQVAFVPEPLVLALTLLVVIVAFLVFMVYAGKALYWFWKQIDDSVLWLWDTLLPESPIVRFGVGLTFMVLVFLIGPLLVLQAVDFMGEGDPVDEAENETSNQTDSDAEEHTVLSYLPPESSVLAGAGPRDDRRTSGNTLWKSSMCLE